MSHAIRIRIRLAIPLLRSLRSVHQKRLRQRTSPLEKRACLLVLCRHRQRIAVLTRPFVHLFCIPRRRIVAPRRSVEWPLNAMPRRDETQGSLGIVVRRGDKVIRFASLLIGQWRRPRPRRVAAKITRHRLDALCITSLSVAVDCLHPVSHCRLEHARDASLCTPGNGAHAGEM